MKVKSMIKNLTLVAILLLVPVAFLLSNVVAQANDMYVSFTEDKDRVNPGDSLTYTIYAHNQTGGDLNNVFAEAMLDSKVEYIDGSAVFHKGDQTFNLTSAQDDWITNESRFNMGTMSADQRNSVIFQVKVPASTALGTTIRSSGYIDTETSDPITRQVDAVVVSRDERTQFATGDTFLAANNTNQVGWFDTVTAKMGNVIEFKFRIHNSGTVEARNAKIQVALDRDPNQPDVHLVSTAYAYADNATTLTDTATVNLTDTASYLWPYDGHYNLVGVTTGLNDYNCPSGCPINRQFLDTQLPIGNIPAGGTVEILFKASVYNRVPTPTPTRSVTPTPTPTRTPTPTITITPTPTVTNTPTPTPTISVTPTVTLTPTPTPTTSTTPTVTPTPTVTNTPTPTVSGTPNECGGTCGSNSNCQSGLFCFEGFCKNPNIVVDGKYACSSNVTPTPTTPHVLGAVAPVAPKTGAGLVELTLGLLGTGAAGFFLRRLAHNIW